MSEPRTDLLIDEIAACEDDCEVFRTFESHAAQQPRAWEELARALRDELHMRVAAQREADAAGADAEIAVAMAQLSARDCAQRKGDVIIVPGARFRIWSGWAAAAVVALVWAVFALSSESSTTAPEQHGPHMQLASFSADDAYERYLEVGHSEGRVIRELPARMVEIESKEDGSVVVYYIRQLLEREHVNQMYRYGADELGQPLPVPFDLNSISVTDSSL